MGRASPLGSLSSRTSRSYVGKLSERFERSHRVQLCKLIVAPLKARPWRPCAHGSRFGDLWASSVAGKGATHKSLDRDRRTHDALLRADADGVVARLDLDRRRRRRARLPRLIVITCSE